MIRHTAWAVAAAAAVTLSGAASAENLRFMTGPQGGSWYPMGGAIKNVVEEDVPDTSMQVMPGAGIANVKAIQAGKADVAFANSVSTVDAINGKPPFEEAATNVCHVATLYPQFFQIVTTQDTGIESIGQVKGRELTTQPTGNTGEAITKHLLEASGFTYDDLSGTDFVSYNDSVALLKDGNSEVFTLGTTVPASAIMDLASARDIRMLPVDDDLLGNMQALNPGYKRIEIPAGSYPGQDAAVPTIGYATHVIARCDLDDGTISGILTQIVDHQQDLAAVAKAIGNTTPEQMSADIGVPFHPAAEQYFKDKGLM
ncbi:MAG: TAXI family TRAP transporter solute-binding subunit, partial [Pseudomonadota bacterium]